MSSWSIDTGHWHRCRALEWSHSTSKPASLTPTGRKPLQLLGCWLGVRKPGGDYWADHTPLSRQPQPNQHFAPHSTDWPELDARKQEAAPISTPTTHSASLFTVIAGAPSSDSYDRGLDGRPPSSSWWAQPPPAAPAGHQQGIDGGRHWCTVEQAPLVSRHSQHGRSRSTAARRRKTQRTVLPTRTHPPNGQVNYITYKASIIVDLVGVGGKHNYPI